MCIEVHCHRGVVTTQRYSTGELRGGVEDAVVRMQCQDAVETRALTITLVCCSGDQTSGAI